MRRIHAYVYGDDPLPYGQLSVLFPVSLQPLLPPYVILASYQIRSPHTSRLRMAKCDDPAPDVARPLLSSSPLSSTPVSTLASSLSSSAAGTTSYIWGVGKHFVAFIKSLLIRTQCLLGVVLFAVGIIGGGFWPTVQLRSAVYVHICPIPGAHLILPAGVCPVITPNTELSQFNLPGPAQQADLRALTGLEGQALTPLLMSMAGSAALSLNIKYAGMEIEEIITLVTTLDMPSKDAILETLDAFLRDARRSIRTLHKLNTRVNGAVDTVLATVEYATKQIGAAPDPSARILWQKTKTKDAVAIEELERVMHVLSNEIARLASDAEENIQLLTELDKHLRALGAFLRVETGANHASLGSLLSSLWTKIGANQIEVSAMRRKEALLKRTDHHREEARARVWSARTALKRLDADITTLRNRATAPALVGKSILVQLQPAPI
jgi:hypothetical protein